MTIGEGRRIESIIPGWSSNPAVPGLTFWLKLLDSTVDCTATSVQIRGTNLPIVVSELVVCS